MEPAWIDSVSREPPWLVLAVYGAIAATGALVVAGAIKGSLASLARRSPSHLTEVVARSAPQPLGFAIFLAEISAGLRWLPLPTKLEMLTRHLLPFALGVISILLLMRVARRAIDAFGRSNPALRSSAGLGRAATWVVGLSLIALLVSDALGISLAPVLTALGIGSLAVALALQDTLSNFFSGIHLVVDKPVRPGDYVRLETGGQEGYVEAIGWRSTLLRNLSGGVVVVPNATLAKSVLTNFGAHNPRLVLRVKLDVALESDAAHVESVFAAEAKKLTDLAGVRGDPAPSVLFVPGPGPWSLGFTILLQLDPSADADLVEDQVKRRFYARMAAEKILLGRWPLPMRDAPKA
jgi:small-conductance mechanosensitive channel